MASMEHICPLSTPPPADYARMRWPQQMRQPKPGDGWHPCPLRAASGELHILNDHEGPHGVSWLYYRGDTTKIRWWLPSGLDTVSEGYVYYDILHDVLMY